MKVTMLDEQGLLDVGFRDKLSPSPSREKDTKREKSEKVLVIPSVKETERKVLVAAYCRVSTEFAEQETSIESQRRHYEEEIKENPLWEFVGVYLEAGVTGTHAEKRAQFQRLLDDCRAHRVDIILTKSISRFARNTTDCLSAVRELSALGVSVRFEKENIDTAAMGTEFMLSVLACLAEDESRSISANVRWGVRRRFAAGTYKLAVAPYGFKKTEDGGLELNPPAAEVVRGIFDAFCRGNGLRKIAATLTATGLPSPRGGAWNPKTIRHILINPVYIGDLLMQKTYRGEDFRQHPNRGELDMYLEEGHHDAVVDHEVFDAAARELAEGARLGGSPTAETNPDQAAKRATRYALSGRMRCGACGKTMYREVGKNRPTYVCHCKGEGCRIPEEDVKAAFITMLNKLSFLGERFFNAVSAENKAVEAADGKLREMRKRLAALDAAALVDGYKGEAWTEKARLLREEEALKKELARALAATPEEEALERLRANVSCWTPAGEVGDFPEAVFAEVVHHVTTLPDGCVEFTFNCGLVLAEGVIKEEEVA